MCQSVSSLLEMLEVRVAGYAIYHAAASRKWCVVEIPENWAREEVLPLQRQTDRWFDTLEKARAELTRRLDGLSGKRT